MSTTLTDDSASFGDNPSISTADFLCDLANNMPGWIEIAYLAPPKVDLNPRTIVDWIETDEIDIFDYERIARGNAAGYGVYYGLTLREKRIPPLTIRGNTIYRRGKQNDNAYLTCLWCDLDVNPKRKLRTPQDAIDRLLNWFGPPPSYIISSGGGAHGVWMLYEPIPLHSPKVRAYVTQVLKGLAAATGGDSAVADLARVFRLPGTVNTKPGRGNAPCEIVDYIPARYKLDQFLTYYNLAKRYAGPSLAPTRHMPEPERGKIPLIRRLQQYLTGGAPNTRRNSELFYAACRLNDAGISITEATPMLSARAHLDGLDDAEIYRTIRSAYAHAGDPNSALPQNDRRQVAAHDRVLDARTRWKERES